mgnify:CR=1
SNNRNHINKLSVGFKGRVTEKVTFGDIKILEWYWANSLNIGRIVDIGIIRD